MKTIKYFAAVAIALIAAASCKKENAPAVSTPAATKTASFTATIPAVKTSIDGSGVQTWTAGDFILVSNGSVSIGTSGNKMTASGAEENESGQLVRTADGAILAEWIEITDEMISNAGKTLSFSTSVDTPDSKYYFFVVNFEGKNSVYAFGTDGSINTRQIQNTNINKLSPQLLGSCPKDGTTIDFINTLSYISLSASGKPYAVTIMSNDGADVASGYKVSQAGSVLSYGGNTENTVSAAGMTLYMFNNNKTGLIPFAPGLSMAEGFTLILWPTSTEFSAAKNLTLEAVKEKTDWATAPTFITTTGRFTTQMGHLVDFGDVSKLVKYNSYYDLWNAGNDIVVDGVVYNKATYTATPVHVTSDTTISTETGIYFVDPSATLTVTSWNPNRIIIGNSLTERSKLALNSHFYLYGNQYLLLKNLDITLSHSNSAMFCLAAGANLTISVDDCYIDNTAQKKPIFTYYATCENPVKLQIINSEIEFSEEKNTDGTLAKLNDNGKNASVVVKNSVLYVNGLDAADNRAYDSRLITGSVGSVLADLTIDHCTFINVGKSGNNIMEMNGAINSMTVTNNYGYTTSTATNYWLYFYGAAEPSSCTFNGNYSTVYSNAFCTKWGTAVTQVAAKVADQFVALDIANRNFKLKTTAYGAQR